MANEALRAGSAPAHRMAPARARPRWRHPTIRRLLRHKLFVTGSIMFLVVALAALLADVIVTADPLDLSIRDRFQAPSAEWIFGTDNFGRSQWSRVLYGARLSLLIGL